MKKADEELLRQMAKSILITIVSFASFFRKRLNGLSKISTEHTIPWKSASLEPSRRCFMKTSKKAKSKKRKAGSLPLYFERLEAAEKICEEVAKDEYQTMRIFTLLQRWQALKQALKQVSEKPS